MRRIKFNVNDLKCILLVTSNTIKLKIKGSLLLYNRHLKYTRDDIYNDISNVSDDIKTIELLIELITPFIE